MQLLCATPCSCFSAFEASVEAVWDNQWRLAQQSGASSTTAAEHGCAGRLRDDGGSNQARSS
jgi:hypothetical protein